jgi:hypothetical protein
VSIAVVDIEDAEVDDIVSQRSAAGAQVIVFGDDPDDLQLIRFKALGATSVLPRQVILDSLADHLPLIA